MPDNGSRIQHCCSDRGLVYFLKINLSKRAREKCKCEQCGINNRTEAGETYLPTHSRTNFQPLKSVCDLLSDLTSYYEIGKLTYSP